MRLIDKNGRLFGKINIIDFLIVVFLVASSLVIILRIQLNQKLGKQSYEAKEAVEITIPVKFIRLSANAAEKLKVGKKEFDNKGTAISEITWLGGTSRYLHTVFFDQENKKRITDALLFERPARVKIRAVIIDKHSYYKGTLIKYDSLLYFNFDKQVYLAVPINEDESMETRLPVLIRFKNVSPEIANNFKNYYEYNEFGKVSGRLIKIASKKISPRTRADKKVGIPLSYDIDVLFELFCTEKNGMFIYNTAPLRIGSIINLTTNLHMTGELIEFIK
ncbi:MAG: DUF4330 domain-containing protein [Candidatus Omnitrophica bacterium]|nr:DUF4330 domain-containing protein [Candidatus Omnitrophota bacterium]